MTIFTTILQLLIQKIIEMGLNQQPKHSFKYWQTHTIIIAMIGYALYYFVRKNFSVAMPMMEAELGVSKTALGAFLTLNGVIYGVSRFCNGFLADRMSARKFMATGLFFCSVVNIGFAFSDKLAEKITGGIIEKPQPKVEVVAEAPQQEIAPEDVVVVTEGEVAKESAAETAEVAVAPQQEIAEAVAPAEDSEAKQKAERAFAVLIVIMGVLWLINGWFQGMGVPPVTPLMSRWIPANELATKMSIWNMSHSIGAGAIMFVGAGLVAVFGDSAWRLCFLLPAIIALVGSIFVLFTLKDRPSDVGYPEIHADLSSEKEKNDAHRTSPAFYRAFLKRMVFRNPIIWILSVTNFLIYVVRFSMLDWGITILQQYKGVDSAYAPIMVALFEFVGGNLGMLVSGWLTDKVFDSRAHRTCVFCSIGAFAAVAMFWLMPNDSPMWLICTVFSLIGFFIYGPQALLGIETANQATNEAAASANGILGVFGYASTIISGVVFGYIADLNDWNIVFITILAFAALSALVIATIWRAKGDGYAEAERISKEIHAEIGE